MTKAEIARQAALDRVGDAYVYGAWDQKCTVANRNRYASLNDEYRDAIGNQCQRTKSNKSTCSGCKYEGRRIHDCRGLTSICAKAVGIVIDGSTVARQWNADTWAEKGPIDTLPELPYVQLFRHNGTKWAHTGIYIGNGETVDARGHVYGVIRKKLSDYKWTHWAIPKGMYEEIPDDAGEITDRHPPIPLRIRHHQPDRQDDGIFPFLILYGGIRSLIRCLIPCMLIRHSKVFPRDIRICSLIHDLCPNGSGIIQQLENLDNVPPVKLRIPSPDLVRRG